MSESESFVAFSTAEMEKWEHKLLAGRENATSAGFEFRAVPIVFHLRSTVPVRHRVGKTIGETLGSLSGGNSCFRNSDFYKDLRAQIHMIYCDEVLRC